MDWKNDGGVRRVTRRSLAKGLAAGLAVAAYPQGAGRELLAEALPQATAGSAQDWVAMYPGVWRTRVGSPESFTPTALRSFPVLQEKLAQLPQATQPPIGKVQASVDRRGVQVALPLAAEENLYGFGLQMLSFAQRGKKKMLRVNADPRFDSGDSHAPVPFYVSSLGYGVYVDTARYAEFCCGNARRVQEPIQEQRAGYTEDAPQLEDKDHAMVTVEVPLATGVDVYLFAGPTMLDAVRRYNLFSGGGVAPPEWGLGFWYRTQAKADSNEVVRFAKEFRERRIPCDVIGLEPGWQSHAYSCTFMWGDGFKDPAAFVRELSALDYKVNLWEHAFVHPTSPIYGAMKPYAGDYAVWSGLVPDFAGKEARTIFGEHHRKTFLEIGISGFKLDECDNSDYTGGWSFPEFSRYPSGQDGEQMHTTFGMLYQRTLLEQFHAMQRPTYSLVRSSGSLAAPYPFVLYSDLYDHRAFVRSLVNSGFSGLLWCPEVRDAKNENDLIRRLQTVVFSPMAMVNGWYIANPPWKQQDRAKNNRGELQPGWEKLEARCREVLEWRMLLLPYLRAAFERYAADGTPPFRAAVMEGASGKGFEAKLVKCDDQFMVGDRMMVAPLFDGEDGREVLLPEGRWHDFWTGAAVAGGQTLHIDAGYEKIPVYVRSGSVLPLGGIGLSTADAATRVLQVQIYGDGSMPFVLGDTRHPELALNWKDGKGQVQQGTAERPYRVGGWKVLTG